MRQFRCNFDGERDKATNVLNAKTVMFFLPVMIPFNVWKTDLFGLKNGC